MKYEIIKDSGVIYALSDNPPGFNKLGTGNKDNLFREVIAYRQVEFDKYRLLKPFDQISLLPEITTDDIPKFFLDSGKTKIVNGKKELIGEYIYE
jgi:hypothetical protein